MDGRRKPDAVVPVRRACGSPVAAGHGGRWHRQVPTLVGREAGVVGTANGRDVVSAASKDATVDRPAGSDLRRKAKSNDCEAGVIAEQSSLDDWRWCWHFG